MTWERQEGAVDETFEATGDARPHCRTALPILQGFSAATTGGGAVNQFRERY